jgi:hypothetical protein
MILTALAALTLHVYVIRLTPVLPVPVLQAEVAATDAFYARSSFGKLRVVADVSPVVENFVVPKECFERPDGVESGLGAFATAARQAAGAPAGYDRYVYVTDRSVCGSNGLGVGDDVLLNANTGFALIHELGHTLGLAHAGSAKCPTCTVNVYGDSFSPMGRGGTDFSTWEKVKLGWLDRSQARVVSTRIGDLWIDRPVDDWLVIRMVRKGQTVMLAAARKTATVPHVLRARLVGERVVVTRLRR